MQITECSWLLTILESARIPFTLLMAKTKTMVWAFGFSFPFLLASKEKVILVSERSFGLQKGLGRPVQRYSACVLSVEPKLQPCGLGSQHPSDSHNVKNFPRFEPQIWPEIITSRDAESTCFEGSRTSCDVIIFALFGQLFAGKDHITWWMLPADGGARERVPATSRGTTEVAPETGPESAPWSTKLLHK